MKRKGQAAMEFLMTYGWAILAAIIVIGVLAIYFRPSSLTSTQVIVTAPFYGVGTTITGESAAAAADGVIVVEIRNNGGEDLTTTAATLTLTSPSGDTCAAGTGVAAIAAGASQQLSFGTCTFSSGESISGDVAITYTRPGGSTLALTSTGSVSGSAA